jgi:hypothetical protein
VLEIRQGIGRDSFRVVVHRYRKHCIASLLHKSQAHNLNNIIIVVFKDAKLVFIAKQVVTHTPQSKNHENK